MLVLLMMIECRVGRSLRQEHHKPGCAQHQYSYIRQMICFIPFVFNDLQSLFHDTEGGFLEWKRVSLQSRCAFHIREVLSGL
jgi:hypothetical protein